MVRLRGHTLGHDLLAKPHSACNAIDPGLLAHIEEIALRPKMKAAQVFVEAVKGCRQIIDDNQNVNFINI